MKILILSLDSKFSDLIKDILSKSHEVIRVTVDQNIEKSRLEIPVDLVINLLDALNPLNKWAQSSGFYKSYWNLVPYSSLNKLFSDYDRSSAKLAPFSIYYNPTRDMVIKGYPIYDYTNRNNFSQRHELGQDHPINYTSSIERFEKYLLKTVEVITSIDTTKYSYVFWDKDERTTYNTEYKSLSAGNTPINYTNVHAPYLEVGNWDNVVKVMIESETVKEVNSDV